MDRSSTVNLTTLPDLGARFELTTNANGTATGQMYEGVTKKSFVGRIEASLADIDHPTLRGTITGSTHVIDLTFDNANDSLSGTLHNAADTASANITAWGNAWSTTPMRPRRDDSAKPLIARHTRWVRAARSGIHCIDVKLGQRRVRRKRQLP